MALRTFNNFDSKLARHVTLYITFYQVTHATCADWIYGGQPAGTRWCSTLVDSQGEHVNGAGNYGFCPSTCPTVAVSPQTLFFSSTRSKVSPQVSSGAISFGGSTARNQPK